MAGQRILAEAVAQPEQAIESLGDADQPRQFSVPESPAAGDAPAISVAVEHFLVLAQLEIRKHDRCLKVGVNGFAPESFP